MVASSDPIIVDGDPPEINGFVKVDTLGTPDASGTVYVQSFAALKLSWGAFKDDESAVSEYSVALGFDECGSEEIAAMHRWA